MDTIDQNPAKDSDSLYGKRKMDQTFPASNFLKQKRTGSRFNLEYVKDANGNAMSYTTMFT
jgi:hypothetical protein